MSKQAGIIFVKGGLRGCVHRRTGWQVCVGVSMDVQAGLWRQAALSGGKGFT